MRQTIRVHVRPQRRHGVGHPRGHRERRCLHIWLLVSDPLQVCRRATPTIWPRRRTCGGRGRSRAWGGGGGCEDEEPKKRIFSLSH
jgi:hypothetical protein